MIHGVALIIRQVSNRRSFKHLTKSTLFCLRVKEEWKRTLWTNGNWTQRITFGTNFRLLPSLALKKKVVYATLLFSLFSDEMFSHFLPNEMNDKCLSNNLFKNPMPKSRGGENVGVLHTLEHTVRNLHFLSKNSTLISRENCRIVLGEKLVKMLWFGTF